MEGKRNRVIDSIIETIGAEPFGADDAYLSLKTGKIQPSINPKTIALCTIKKLP